MTISPVKDRLAALVAREKLGDDAAPAIETIWLPLAERILDLRAAHPRCCIIGLSGPQGSGKSTGAAILTILLEAAGETVANLSLDDFYLQQSERRALAERVHPLLVTRGPPGTHDVVLLTSVVERLRAGECVAVPRFSKALDDRLASEGDPRLIGPAGIILLEGWCVGAAPQAADALIEPINDLEKQEDPDSEWRSFCNAALGRYQPLFERLDCLVQLRPPAFDTVLTWRREQEAKLRAASPTADVIMTDVAVDRFVQHFERLTRHMLAEMPSRADAVVQLDPRRRGLKTGPAGSIHQPR